MPGRESDKGPWHGSLGPADQADEFLVAAFPSDYIRNRPAAATESAINDENILTILKLKYVKIELYLRVA